MKSNEEADPTPVPLKMTVSPLEPTPLEQPQQTSALLAHSSTAQASTLRALQPKKSRGTFIIPAATKWTSYFSPDCSTNPQLSPELSAACNQHFQSPPANH